MAGQKRSSDDFEDEAAPDAGNSSNAGGGANVKRFRWDAPPTAPPGVVQGQLFAPIASSSAAGVSAEGTSPTTDTSASSLSPSAASPLSESLSPSSPSSSSSGSGSADSESTSSDEASAEEEEGPLRSDFSSKTTSSYSSSSSSSASSTASPSSEASSSATASVLSPQHETGLEPPIITLPRPPKPSFSAAEARPGNFISRVSAFLPRLAAANASLEEDRAAGTLDRRNLENVEDGREYIEMNLGLGVLEEKSGRLSVADSSSSSSSSDGEGEGGMDQDGDLVTPTTQTPHARERSVLERLMRRKGKNTPDAGEKVRPTIEEVSEQ